MFWPNFSIEWLSLILSESFSPYNKESVLTLSKTSLVCLGNPGDINAFLASDNEWWRSVRIFPASDKYSRIFILSGNSSFCGRRQEVPAPSAAIAEPSVFCSAKKCLSRLVADSFIDATTSGFNKGPSNWQIPFRTYLDNMSFFSSFGNPSDSQTFQRVTICEWIECSFACDTDGSFPNTSRISSPISGSFSIFCSFSVPGSSFSLISSPATNKKDRGELLSCECSLSAMLRLCFLLVWAESRPWRDAC